MPIRMRRALIASTRLRTKSPLRTNEFDDGGRSGPEKKGEPDTGNGVPLEDRPAL